VEPVELDSFAARRSAFGVSITPPKAEDAPKPMSSSRMSSTFGAPEVFQRSVMGGNAVSGSFAS